MLAMPGSMLTRMGELLLMLKSIIRLVLMMLELTMKLTLWLVLRFMLVLVMVILMLELVFRRIFNPRLQHILGFRFHPRSRFLSSFIRRHLPVGWLLPIDFFKFCWFRGPG